jgi:hypothetical protein
MLYDEQDDEYQRELRAIKQLQGVKMIEQSAGILRSGTSGNGEVRVFDRRSCCLDEGCG